MPFAVPGVAVSPGAKTCNFVKAPALTVIAGLALADLVPSAMSLAVSVALPAVFSVTLNVCVPAVSAALEGRLALASLEEIPTKSVALLTIFQFASTAFAVTVKALPALCAVGVPVFPLAVPGAEVSPGTRSWSLVNAPALTVIGELVLMAIAECVVFEAVTVAVPAVFSVTLKLFVPELSAALAGKTALASLEVIATVSFVLIRFQLASTALTVTLKAVPAV